MRRILGWGLVRYSPHSTRARPLTNIYAFVERRTTESQVSGSINMNLSACVENDVAFAPFHDQYMRLHEVNRKSRIDFNVFKFFFMQQMFVHMHLTQSLPLLSISPKVHKSYDYASYERQYCAHSVQVLILCMCVFPSYIAE